MTPTPFPALMARLAHERGQAMVEFAMVLPVLMLIIVGILTFGRYLNYGSQETQMAAEAARYAAINVNPSSSIQSYVQAQATGELGAGSSSVTSKAQVYIYYPTGSGGTVGQPVRACVISTVSLLPMLGAVTSAQIVETATMRIEQASTQWAVSTGVPSQCPAS
jgi:Flp pilus assembly protein TadG